MAGRYSR